MLVWELSGIMDSWCASDSDLLEVVTVVSDLVTLHFDDWKNNRVPFYSLYMQALWQLLWVLTNKQQTGPVQKPGLDSITSRKMFSTQVFQPFVSKAASRLLAEVCSHRCIFYLTSIHCLVCLPLYSWKCWLSLTGCNIAFSIVEIWFRLSPRSLQLHDRNSRRQFTPSEDFHAREGVDEYFVTQVSTRESLVNVTSQFFLGVERCLQCGCQECIVIQVPIRLHVSVLR